MSGTTSFPGAGVPYHMVEIAFTKHQNIHQKAIISTKMVWHAKLGNISCSPLKGISLKLLLYGRNMM